MSLPALAVIDDATRQASVLQPVRRRVLESLIEPNSASGLSRHLELPRQKINYHLRELERDGFVELIEERRRGNCIERIVQATARAYLISPDVLGTLSNRPDAVQDRFSSTYLLAAAAQIVRDVAVLQRRAEAVDKTLPTLTVQADVRFANAADRKAFAEELTQTLATLVSRYHDEDAPEGREFRFVVGSHPVITKTEAEAAADAATHCASPPAPSTPDSSGGSSHDT